MQRNGAMAAFATITTILFVASILQPPKGVSSNLWCYQCDKVNETTESCNEFGPCDGNATFCFASFNNVTKIRQYGCDISATFGFRVRNLTTHNNTLRTCRAQSTRNPDKEYCGCDTDCCNTWTELGKGGPNENGCPTTTSATFKSGAAKPKQKLLLISVIVLAATLPVA